MSIYGPRTPAGTADAELRSTDPDWLVDPGNVVTDIRKHAQINMLFTMDKVFLTSKFTSYRGLIPVDVR